MIRALPNGGSTRRSSTDVVFGLSSLGAFYVIAPSWGAGKVAVILRPGLAGLHKATKRR